MAVRILVPEPGIELMSPALEAQSLNQPLACQGSVWTLY